MKKLLILWLITFSSVLFAQKSTTTSIQELETRCNNNRYISCTVLGGRYQNGEDVRQDKLKAVELYQTACESNHADGCLNLSVMYSNGEGVQQDKSKALNFSDKACDLRSEKGCQYYVKLRNNGLKY